MGIQRLDDMYRGQCHALRVMSEYLRFFAADMKREASVYYNAVLDFMGEHAGDFVSGNYPRLKFRNHKRGKATKSNPRGKLLSCEAYIDEKFF